MSTGQSNESRVFRGKVSRRMWGLSFIVGITIDRTAEALLAFKPGPRQGHAAVRKGVDYIIALQGTDGAWKSSRYSVFQREGELTAFIAHLLSVHCMHYPGVGEAISRAIRHLRGIDFTKIQLSYPVYTLAFLNALSARKHQQYLAYRPSACLLKTLEKYRFGTENGWSEKDAYFGGWGYESFRPTKNSQAKSLFHGPNISATTFGLMAYRDMGLMTDDFRIEQVYKFVIRCQHMKRAGDMHREYGGFFFSPTDVIRNKAGLLGGKLNGKVFHAYGSATADGLRALKLCGCGEDHPRVKAARGWLLNRISKNRHPGTFTDSREHLRDSYFYYFCWSLAAAFHDVKESSHLRNAQIVETLEGRQSSDGSWSNLLTDGKEDDPLIATPMAVSTIELLSSACA